MQRAQAASGNNVGGVGEEMVLVRCWVGPSPVYMQPAGGLGVGHSDKCMHGGRGGEGPYCQVLVMGLEGCWRSAAAGGTPPQGTASYGGSSVPRRGGAAAAAVPPPLSGCR